MEKERVEIEHTTLDFYKYEKDSLTFYEFDATMSQAPEPMVNTMCALKMLVDKNDRLVGRFFHEPFPLFQRIEKNFIYESKELEDGNFLVTFCKK